MKLVDKFIHDKNGKIAVFQTPNIPIIVYFGAVILRRLFSEGQAYQFFDLIAFGALFTWAWLEIFQGDSYFRRVLGGIVLVVSVFFNLK